MADYRFLLTDILTGATIGEYPFFGVTFSRRLNKVGNATLTWQGGGSDFPEADFLGSTIPGRAVFWIQRDDTLVWGGPIWSRTYSSEDHVYTMTAQTIESILYRNFIEYPGYTYTNKDQVSLLVDLINKMTAKPQYGIDIDTSTLITPSSILRTENFPGYDAWTFGKAVEYLIAYDTGFDYSIEPMFDPLGNPTFVLRAADTLGLRTDALQFDYPGGVKKYWWPENAASGAATVLGFGAGDKTEKLHSKKTNTVAWAQNYPDYQISIENGDVSVQATLDAQTQGALNASPLPVAIPTFHVEMDADPVFGSYMLGDYATFNVDDYIRFADEDNNTKVVTQRIVGWDVSVPDDNTDENCALVIEGQDDA